MPLPSLFFIGKNGTPIEIVTGVTKTVDELKSKIDHVLSTTKPSSATPSAAATASASFIASTENSQKFLNCFDRMECKIYFFLFLDEQSSSNDDTEVVCENGVCYKRPKQTATATAPAETESGPSSSTNGQQVSIHEKLAEVKELMVKKRKEKEEEDARVS